ncbi:DNA replication/repair protein RecF [Thiorhodovibrio frisius]|uniref:DNA replication and repair protein RecF n=1 Tax=Thiorhodovibrio frisius TaxID=631362 RepID=H8Z1H0_9GAMM|nr:DNA replication and repair protein RecF [Thiorhodovibrio frisius]EIC22519.1 recF protein [Thiorhodovibrio frisius]WPL19958.1 DNA replication and repair protein RecF [Thiorhodovibrio frisius]
MWIRRLRIEGIRNLEACDLECGEGLNLVIGSNGAGKTSFLEAIYFLNRGSTFRGKKAGPMRQEGGRRCFVGCWGTNSSGVEWRGSRSCEKAEAALAGRRKGADSKLDKLMVRLISDSVYLLVEGQPELRRRFIDWNLFHVEPGYGSLVREYRRTLSQRNAWLKAGASGPPVWDEPYVRLSLQLEQLREGYCLSLNKCFQESCGSFGIGDGQVSIRWVGGFDKQHLRRDLVRMLETDRRRGFTFHGPDRADFQVVTRDGVRLGSRGQNKAFGILLQIAASQLGGAKSPRDIWLVDDIGSELSEENAQSLVGMIQTHSCQVFLTALSQPVLDSSKMFHVEQGVICPAD